MSELHRKKLFYGWWLVFLAMFLAMVALGRTNILGVLFPSLRATFGWSSAQTSAIVSAMTVGGTVASLILSPIFKKYSPRKLLLIIGTAQAAGYLGMIYAKNIIVFYALGFVCGFGAVGAGSLMVPVILTNWFDSKRSVAIGMGLAGSGLAGLLLAPVFANLVYAQKMGYQVGFLIFGTIALISTLAMVLSMTDKPEQKGWKPYGHNPGDPQPLSAVSSANKDTEQTGLSVSQVIRLWQFWGLGFAAFGFGLSAVGVMIQVLPHLVNEGYSTAVAAGIVSLYSLTLTGGKFVFGFIMDKLGIYVSLYVGYLSWIICLLSLAFAGHYGFLMYVFAIVMVIGGPVVTIAAPILTSRMFGTKYYGPIYAIVLFCLSVGSTIGPIITGASRDITGHFTIGIIIIAAVCFVAMIIVQMSYKSAMRMGFSQGIQAKDAVPSKT